MPALELLLLAAIWGGSFLFMRVGAPVLGPVPLIALRVATAALVLLPILRRAELREQLRRRWWPLAVVGLSNSALPFTLFAVGALHLGAGFESILNATTPLWAACIGALWFGSPISRTQGLGLLLGFGGVVILVGEHGGAGTGASLLAAAPALLAPVCYGFAVHYARRHLARTDPMLITFASQAFAALMLAAPGAALWPAGPVPATIWAAVLALGILCTGVAYVMYFRLVLRVGAAHAASVTFLIPVFGMLWGALFLHESVHPSMIVGSAVILAGTALAGGQWRRLLRRPAA
jgi:drug/metabolite transporter (DMT)-like permease